jgi:hypothetical protein
MHKIKTSNRVSCCQYRWLISIGSDQNLRRDWTIDWNFSATRKIFLKCEHRQSGCQKSQRNI